MNQCVRLVILLALGPFAATAQSPLAVEGLADDAPLTIEASATRAALIVDFVIGPEWHLYARDVGGGEPISFAFAADSGLVAAGAPRIPSDERGHVTGETRVVVPLEPRGDSEDTLAATLRFMVCDALMCLPPIEVRLSGRIEPRSVLLVVGTRSERSARIEAFVEARGFTCDVTTYREVTAAECDRHDVVLADSELFRAPRDKGVRATEFPRTETPIVAVGFLGTQLIEAHGLAMTSGYI